MHAQQNKQRINPSEPTSTHPLSQVDFEVWKRAHNFFDFETLTPIKAKGYVNPVPVFRPLGQALKDDDNKVRKTMEVGVVRPN